MARYVDIECSAVTEVISRKAFKSREDIQDFLDNIPTADVEPVRHGHWVYDHWCEFKCSECGEPSNSKPYKGKEIFCPHCGARMDGKKVE